MTTTPFDPAAATPPSPLSSSFDEAGSTSRTVRWLAAGFSLAAAAIHFGFAPGHLSEDWRHGAFFLVLGWFQLLWAIGIVARPSRGLLWSGIVVSLGTIGLWAVTRTVGLPTFLTGDGTAESVTLGDQMTTILEALIVVASVGILTRPDWRTNAMRAPRLASGLGFAAIAAVLVASSLSLTPRYTSGHSHGEGGGHGHGEESAEGGHDHGSTNGADAGHGDHEMAGEGHEHADGAAAGGDHEHMTGMPYNGDSPCEKATAHYPVDPGKDADPTAGHNHHGALPQEPIDDATRQELRAQQEQARAVVDRYPTVADALADGYNLSTVYLPCIGAHYTKIPNVARFDPSEPSELLYDGTEDDSKIVGLSYLIVHDGVPEGFAGPNDVWHQHNANGGLCMNPQGVVIGGEQMSEETCRERGGRKNSLDNIWMVHDWIVPGWECSWGVFAAECPELGGRPGGSAHDPIT